MVSIHSVMGPVTSRRQYRFPGTEQVPRPITEDLGKRTMNGGWVLRSSVLVNIAPCW